MKKLQKNPKYSKTFQKLDCKGNVTPELFEQLEEFNCLMYGSCADSHAPHVDRVNHRVAMFKGHTSHSIVFLIHMMDKD